MKEPFQDLVAKVEAEPDTRRKIWIVRDYDEKRKGTKKQQIAELTALVKSKTQEAIDALDFMGIPLKSHDCLPDGKAVCCRLAKIAAPPPIDKAALDERDKRMADKELKEAIQYFSAGPEECMRDDFNTAYNYGSTLLAHLNVLNEVQEKVWEEAQAVLERFHTPPCPSAGRSPQHNLCRCLTGHAFNEFGERAAALRKSRKPN